MAQWFLKLGNIFATSAFLIKAFWPDGFANFVLSRSRIAAHWGHRVASAMRFVVLGLATARK